MSHSHNHNISIRSEIPHKRAFIIGIVLNITFVILEIIFGLLANSSALLADAGHNASDVFGLFFAMAAAWMATIKPKGKYTYGFRKSTILVSVLNALLLFGAASLIALSAIGKLLNPEPVYGTQIIVVAAIGVVINTFTAFLFVRGQKNDLNIKGAFLHMVADAAISLGVVIAGLLINLTGLLFIDPLISLIIVAIIVWSTWDLFMASLNLALDAVPKNIDINKVKEFIQNQKGVADIHDLHVWALSTSQIALSAHLYMPKGSTDDFLQILQKKLENEFGIKHTTIQIENKDFDCETNCYES